MARKIVITTVRNSCPDRQVCPAILTIEDRPDRRYVVLTQVTDPDELAALKPFVGAGEVVGYGPEELFA
jgi:hypothetical protein